MKKSPLFAAALLTLVTASSVLSFDIAIYGDPLSAGNEQFLRRCRNGFWYGSRDQDSTVIYGGIFGNQLMNSCYEWYRDMGVTKVMVNYIYPDNFARMAQAQPDCTHIQVMNWNYPGRWGMRGDKYVDSQFREVHVGDVDNRYWSFDNSIGGGASRTNSPPLPNRPSRPVVAKDSGSAATIWLPTSFLGYLSGWDGLQTGFLDGSIYMPMHFRLTWAVDPNGTISTGDTLAEFYFFVHTPNDTINGVPNVAWWRLPARALTLRHPADTLNWIDSTYVDSVNSGWYHLLDSNFVVMDSSEWYDLHFGSANPRSLDDNTAINAPSYGGAEVRMAVWYGGRHSFFLNRVEIFDDGYWRMFVSADSAAYQDTLWKAFKAERDSSYGKLAGWYYDEWNSQGEPLKSLVKVNKLLQTNGLPTFFINGYHSYTDNLELTGPPYELRNQFMALLNGEGVHMSAHMDEFYPFAGDSGCTPDNAGEWPTEYMLTSTSSDVEYLDIQSAGDTCSNSDNITWPCCDGCTWYPYVGVQSLQCAIDGYMDPNANARYVHDTKSLCTYACPGDYSFTSRVEQARFVHDNEQMFWALIPGGADWGGGDPAYRWMLRYPTPNEVKLVAWLAVACDADGIMWYPWSFGGLLALNDEYEPTAISTTERYDAAAQVGREIKRIASTLEPLAFVKTYASRAFEQDYGDANYAATALDTLSTQDWCNNSIRAVQAIRAYEPCSPGDTTCFADGPESEPYVQVSRFRNRHVPYLEPSVEDYWFMVVNRRALADEWRKVELEIPVIYQGPYYARYLLGDSTHLQPLSSVRTGDCYYQTIALYLRPGEAELVHFTRGENGCQDASALIDSLTAIREGEDGIRLRWEEPTLSVDSLPFTPQIYFILRSVIGSSGGFDTIAFAETNTYLDTLALPEPKAFYMIHACGTIEERPGGTSIGVPDKPRKEKVISEIVN